MINELVATKYTNKVVDQYLRKVSKGIVAIMRNEVPVDTGVLRASVASEQIAQNYYRIGHRKGLLIAKSGQDYGADVYFGTKGKRPNDWIGRTMSKVSSII